MIPLIVLAYAAIILANPQQIIGLQEYRDASLSANTIKMLKKAYRHQQEQEFECFKKKHYYALCEQEKNRI